MVLLDVSVCKSFIDLRLTDVVLARPPFPPGMPPPGMMGPPGAPPFPPNGPMPPPGMGPPGMGGPGGFPPGMLYYYVVELCGG